MCVRVFVCFLRAGPRRACLPTRSRVADSAPPPRHRARGAARLRTNASASAAPLTLACGRSLLHRWSAAVRGLAPPGSPRHVRRVRAQAPLHRKVYGAGL
eukprot:4956167-Pleurochrysis_carterae.AAC.1